jgi:hypothetical protein
MKNLIEEYVVYACLVLMVGALIGIAVRWYVRVGDVREAAMGGPDEQRDEVASVSSDGNIEVTVTRTHTGMAYATWVYLTNSVCRCPQCMFHNAPTNSSAWYMMNHPDKINAELSDSRPKQPTT